MKITVSAYARRALSLLLILAVVAGFMPMPAAAVDATGVKLSANVLTVFTQETVTLTATILPTGATYSSISWQYTGDSSDPGLGLTPDGTTCEVRGIREGTASIIVTIVVGTESYTDKCDVTVIPRVMITGITLDSYTKTLNVEESFEIVATAEPSTATDTSMVWSIQNSDIAELSAQSTENKEPITVTAKAPGKTTITARANDGSGISATFTLTVTAPPERIMLDSTATVVVGKTLKMSATVMPTTAYSKKVVWISDNDTIARINYETGLVTAVSVGTCTIRAYEENHDTVFAECTLTVTISPVPTTGLAFNHSQVTVIEKKTTPLVVNITPTNASNRKVHLTSSDITIATVPATANAGSSFNVTGVKPGKVIITAKSDETNSIVSVCEVEVIATPATPVTKITLNTTAATLAIGGTVTPKATLTPTNPTINTLTWTTSNANVATVDTAGKITATGPGVATITAIANGGNKVEATCVINVVTLNSSTLSLQQDETYLLKVLDMPPESGLSVAWSSNKTAVATLGSTSGESVLITAQGAGEATITATVKRGTTTVVTLKCAVSVTSNASTISYHVAGAGTASFAVNDFNAVCTTTSGNDLNYIKFILPSTTVGTLYYLYDKTGESRVSASTFYYRSGTPKISDVCFVPSSTFVGTTIISYTAVDTKGNTYTGKISVTVGDATGDIKYSTGMGTPVTFSGADFNAYCTQTTGNALNSVKFTLPKATEGVLYYMYELDNNQKITGSKLTADSSYYFSSDPNLNDVTFLPTSSFVGSVEIKFTGRDEKTNLISGTVRITVGRGSSSGADIEYKIEKNAVCDFLLEDFNEFCRGVAGGNLSYVQFTLPAAIRGTLYHEYSSRRATGTLVTATRRYYRNASPYLADVSFVPATDFQGTVTIQFTGMSVGGKTISGTVAVIVGDEYGDVRYAAGINMPITFGNEEFNDFCKGEVGAALDYIQLSLPKATEGVLYHQYGRSGETLVDANTHYRRTASLRLDEITFIPVQDFVGVVEFPFTGRSVTGVNISGTVALTYDPSLLGTPIIYYDTEYAPVAFSTADFTDACSKRGAASLVSVEFVLPPASVGRLYESYRNHNNKGTALPVDNLYTLGSGAGAISSVSFVPRAGTTGTVAIPYTGTDSKGDTFTGYVHISIPTVAASSFSDMSQHTWASASVEYMRSTGVVTGIGSNRYGPGMSITRGDFMLMLYRAFALSGRAGTTNFSDVPANSYYAQAIATARAMGIALGGTDGKFRPQSALTRQDALVLIHRLLTYLGQDVDEASVSLLNSFTDGRNVSDYARYAVADLISTGIVQGDNQSRLNPLTPVTRAEMAVILHRVLTR